jgi:hypothetical protein
MKKKANIIQLILTILAAFAIVLMVSVGAHNRHPTTFQIVLEVISLVTFYLWLIFSVIHLFVWIVRKFVKTDSN